MANHSFQRTRRSAPLNLGQGRGRGESPVPRLEVTGSWPDVSPASRSARASVGYATASWALTFALLHVAWAAGWYVLLPKEEAVRAFSQRWFWAYDVVVAGACGLAMLVALALVQPWGQRVPRWLLGGLAWSGTALLVLRGGGGALQAAYLVATGRFSLGPMHLYEFWFCLGAVLFSVTLWQSRRASRASCDTPPPNNRSQRTAFRRR